MLEGWFGDDYLILFEERAADLDRSYGVGAALPGYRLVGLRSWDDFIVEDATGARFTVPTVPLTKEQLAPFNQGTKSMSSLPDPKMRGRIKWYVTPIVFGGDPNLGQNVSWVTLEQHTQLVPWWNKKYLEVKTGRGGTPAA